jgi:hypothetical protein
MVRIIRWVPGVRLLIMHPPHDSLDLDSCRPIETGPFFKKLLFLSVQFFIFPFLEYLYCISLNGIEEWMFSFGQKRM